MRNEKISERMLVFVQQKVLEDGNVVTENEYGDG